MKESDAGQRNCEQYEVRITTMSQELNAVRKQLKEASNKPDTSSPLLLDLQKEMEKMKVKLVQIISDSTPPMGQHCAIHWLA